METFFFKLSSMLHLLLIALIQMHGYEACFETEGLALLELKRFFISASDTEYADEILTSWVHDPILSDCCGWEGVKCNATTRRVMELSLDDTTMISNSNGVRLLNLSLFLPFEELQSLDLYGNWFDGVYENKAYDSFGSLKQLNILNLGSNNFNNNILPYLNTLTSLTTLILSYNRIDDLKLKQGLANLINLQVLDLSGNSNITRPGLVANFPNLKELQLGSCGITTTQGLANLRNLQVLDLSGNSNLTRPVLANFPNLKELQPGFCEITTIQRLAKFRDLKALDLSNNKITGTLESPGICELKNLFELNLGENNFEGHLPLCLNNLTRLKVLDISSNQLTGNLPSSLLNLTSLEYLDLSNNNFTGLFSFCSLANLSKLEVFLLTTGSDSLQVKNENCLPMFQLEVLILPNRNLSVIPSFLLHQYNLEYLDLSHNKLVGNFPTWFLENNTNLDVLLLTNNSFSEILQLPHSQHDLSHLDISSNSFIGKLPLNMGVVLHKLIYLNMSNNILEGGIPYSIGAMKQLQFLSFSRNNFSGELSATLLTSYTSLSSLDLSHNNFHGQIFPKYMNLTGLLLLDLNNNSFSGNIEDGLLSSTNLRVLDISNNVLFGHIPPWIANFSYLTVLLMSKNHLEGNIPVQFNNLQRLAVLNIYENNLFGPLSPTFNLSSMKYLYVQKNALSGLIPSAFFKSSALIILDLSDNKFYGKIPSQINKNSKLYALLLKGNYLQGPIPNQLCQLQNLGIMDLSSNQLNGSIPSCIANTLSSGAETKYWYGISYFGHRMNSYYNSTILLQFVLEEDHEILHQPAEVHFMTKKRYEIYERGILELMRGLDLSSNELTGNIPSEIGDLQNILALNLSHNSLSGAIPESFSNLKVIECLDLSHNKLSGQIPPQLTALNFLSNFNVSYNNLSGPTPNAGQFANFDEENYGHNPGLCGPRINKSCTSIPDFPETPSSGAEEDESAVDKVAFYRSFVASSVIMILSLLAILWVNPYWRRLWFYFIEECIDLCYYWLFKYVF